MKTLSDYPSFLHPLFEAVGRAMDRPQVHPGVLATLPSEFAGFAPGQVVRIRHVSAAEAGGRRGHYEVKLSSPETSLRWKVWPRELQALANDALRQSPSNKPKP